MYAVLFFTVNASSRPQRKGRQSQPGGDADRGHRAGLCSHGTTVAYFAGHKAASFLRHDGEIPLTVESLTGITDERYRKGIPAEESVFLSRMICSQYPSLDAAGSSLAGVHHPRCEGPCPSTASAWSRCYTHRTTGGITEMGGEAAPLLHVRRKQTPRPLGRGHCLAVHSYGEPRTGISFAGSDRIVNCGRTGR